MAENSKKRARKSKLVPRCTEDLNEIEEKPKSPEETDQASLTILPKLRSGIDRDEHQTDRAEPIALSVNVEVEVCDTSVEGGMQDYEFERRLRTPDFQARFSLDELQRTMEELSKKTTSVADKVIEIEIRNNLGKNVQKLIRTRHENLVQNAISAWRYWCIQAKYRDFVKLYKCYICEMAWWHLYPFQEHIKIHTRIKVSIETFQHDCCIVCSPLTYESEKPVKDIYPEGECSRCQKGYEVHMTKQGLPNYRCPLCNTKYRNCVELARHEGVCLKSQKISFLRGEVICESIICDVCKINCLTTERYSAHMVGAHTVRSDSPIVVPLSRPCSQCDRTLFSFVSHWCPKRPEDYACHYCFRKFQSKFFESIHNAHTKRPATCGVCRYTIPRKCLEAEHMIRHTKNYMVVLKCIECPDVTVLPNQRAYKVHRDACHKNAKKTRFRSDTIIVPKACVYSHLEKIIKEPVQQTTSEKIGGKTSGKERSKSSKKVLPKVNRDVFLNAILNMERQEKEIDMIELQEDGDSDIEIQADELQNAFKQVFRRISRQDSKENNVQDLVEQKYKILHQFEETENEDNDEENTMENEYELEDNDVRKNEIVELGDGFTVREGEMIHNDVELMELKHEIVEMDDELIVRNEEVINNVVELKTIKHETMEPDDEFMEPNDELIETGDKFTGQDDAGQDDEVFVVENIKLEIEDNIIVIEDSEAESEMETSEREEMETSEREEMETPEREEMDNEDILKILDAEMKSQENEISQETLLDAEGNESEDHESTLVIDERFHPDSEMETQKLEDKEIKPTFQINGNDSPDELSQDNETIVNEETVEATHKNVEIDKRNVLDVQESQLKTSEIKEEIADEVETNYEEMDNFEIIGSEQGNSDYVKRLSKALHTEDVSKMDAETLFTVCDANVLSEEKVNKQVKQEPLDFDEAIMRHVTEVGFSDDVETREAVDLIRKSAEQMNTDVKEEVDIDQHLEVTYSDEHSSPDDKASLRYSKLYKCKCGFVGVHFDYKNHRLVSCPPKPYRMTDGKKKDVDEKLEKCVCTKCDTVFESIGLYFEHITDHGLPQLTCPQCYQILSPMEVTSHIKHHVINSFIKLRCINKSDSSASTVSQLHQCKTCSVKVTQSDFFSHWESHLSLRGKQESDVGDRDGDQAMAPQALSPVDLKMVLMYLQSENFNFMSGWSVRLCERCEKGFIRKNDAKRHLIEHLLMDAFATKDSRGLMCQLCKKTFSNSNYYKAHMRLHGSMPIFNCDICNKTFSDSSNFAKHKKLHNFKFLVCDTCKKKFHSRKMIIRHMQLHRENNEFPCNICQIKLYSQSALTKHLKKVHRNVPCTYPCHICHERFVSVRDKWDHLWQVHKERNQIADCPLCDQSFRKLQDVRAHVRTQHPHCEIKNWRRNCRQVRLKQAAAEAEKKILEEAEVKSLKQDTKGPDGNVEMSSKCQDAVDTDEETDIVVLF